MATIDKAAIGFSIAIVAIGVAVAMYGEATQDNITSTAPIERQTPPPPQPIDEMKDEHEMKDEMTDKEMKDEHEMKDEMTDKEMKDEHEMKDDREKGAYDEKMDGKDKKDMMALSIMFGPSTETIEIFTSHDLTDEKAECPDNKLEVNEHCVPYHIKGGTVTDVNVNADENSVAITIDATDEGYIALFKSKEAIDSIIVILLDGEETNDYMVMEKSEMKEKMKEEKMREKDEMKYEKDEMEEDTMVENNDGNAETNAEPKTVVVDMPEGSAVIGCQDDDTCYIPSSVTINVGDTVSWINTDTAAHTVTSGSPAQGYSNLFDSSLVMAGQSFEYTFNEKGTIEYFCIVHPWMVGSVTVN